ncbi:MAG: terminase family protein [Methanothrix sp.]|nr:terminase family protein [Methanothrix sp.]MCX8207415.1 terminase family protein [Methanothrix sp.]
MLNCSRQSGKSTVTSLLALHTAIYRPGSLILCLSPTLRQSSELFRTVARFYHMSTAEMVPAEAESALRLELENRSRIISLPGKEQTIRGFSSASLLLIDEAARVPDELYYSVRPMLAVSKGRLVLLSTPFGKRGFFYDIWTSGEGWEKIMITADDCPRISKDFLREEERSMPRAWFMQEYYCQFVDTEDQVFSSDEIEAMFDDSTPHIEI